MTIGLSLVVLLLLVLLVASSWAAYQTWQSLFESKGGFLCPLCMQLQEYATKYKVVKCGYPSKFKRCHGWLDAEQRVRFEVWEVRSRHEFVPKAYFLAGNRFQVVQLNGP